MRLGEKPGKVPTGWVLARGTITHRHSGRVLLQTGSGGHDQQIHIFDLPVLRNGRFQAIIFLSPDTQHISFILPETSEVLPPEIFTIRRIGRVERIARMALRIYQTQNKLTAHERKQTGITSRKNLLHLSRAYQQSLALTQPLEYSQWLRQVDRLDSWDRHRIRQHIIHFQGKPHFRIALLNTAQNLDIMPRTASSLKTQIYQCFAVTNHSNLNARCPDEPDNEWIIILHPGDELAEHALYWIASVICSVPDVALIYADDDIIDRHGQRTSPRFKPDWSAELLRSTNYIGNAAAFPSAVFHNSGAAQAFAENAGMHDILLRISERLSYDQIVHIPAILLHQAESRRDIPDESPAVRNHLIRLDKAATVEETREGCFRIKYALPDPAPFISILIPTRDNLPLLQRCLSSIMEKSTFRNFEIIVIDNRSRDPEVRKYLAHVCSVWPVRVIAYDHAFNFSTMNNIAAQHARGTVLCLLNNDTEVISPDWLEEMLGHLTQDRVAVVGAKLFYPDGSVQHAGDVVGAGGIANHLHSCIAYDEPGYCNRAIVAQDLSAVTAACMLTWRHTYLSLGGLNEKRLPVAFNDVDYCLRIRRSGYRVIFTPHAHLYHHESVSRGGNFSGSSIRQAEREKSFMRREWNDIITKGDPFYNPNLSRHRADFSLGHVALMHKPWYSKETEG